MRPDGDPGALLAVLVVLAAAVGVCVLWALVVRWWDRRQDRVDLVALEERWEAERVRGRELGGATDRELDEARRAFYRTDEPPDVRG